MDNRGAPAVQACQLWARTHKRNKPTASNCRIYFPVKIHRSRVCSSLEWGTTRTPSDGRTNEPDAALADGGRLLTSQTKEINATWASPQVTAPRGTNGTKLEGTPQAAAA